MGYMDLMAKAENLELLRGLVNTFLSTTTVEPSSVFDLEDGFRETTWMEHCANRLKEEPASAKLIEERYMGPEYDLESMLDLPSDSIGYTYAKIMSVKGFDPHFYRDRESIEDESDYITMRVRKTHDLYHVLSGFDMAAGELGTIAINVLQTSYPGFMLVELISLAMAAFPGLRDRTRAEEMKLMLAFDTISAGIAMARQAKPLFPLKFEEMLDRPLHSMRELVNITPIKEGPSSWYQDPALRDLGLA